MLLFSFFPPSLDKALICMVFFFLMLLFLHCFFEFFLCWESSSGKLPELVLEENTMRRMQIPVSDVHAVLFQEYTTV